MKLRSLFIGIVATSLGACGADQEPAAPEASAPIQDVIDADLVLLDVALVPMTDERVIEGQTVVIRDGIVVEIGPSSDVAFSDTATVVTGEGRYLIPGLADMHVHGSGFPQWMLDLFLGNGVTLVRSMSGRPAYVSMREEIEAGTMLGPRIVTAGPIVDGAPPALPFAVSVTTAQDAIAEIEAQRVAGYDFLKVYHMLSPEAFDAIASHAREADFPFGGHVPTSITLEHAIRSGMRSFEHTTFRWRTESIRADGPAADVTTIQDDAERRARYPILVERIRSGEIAWDDVFDAQRGAELAALAAERNVWFVPTLVNTDRGMTSRRQVETRRDEPGMRFVNESTLVQWSPSDEAGSPSDAVLEAQQVVFREAYKHVKTLQDAGAGLLAGTDTPGAWVVPGVSVHQELALLVQAGLTPYEALVTATRAPAEFLEDESFGTIEVGKRADLVLLEGNPLNDISATQAIVGIVIQNRWLSRDELNGRLDAVAGDAGE